MRARTSGLLAEQIAIRHRAIRCRASWKSHLQSSKAFIARNSARGKHVAVLGSGHLHDIDLRHLKKNFERITLVDIVHPLEIRILSQFSGGSVRLLSGDLSGALGVKNPSHPVSIEEKILNALRDADTLISACVLTQLSLPAIKKWSGRFSDQEVAHGVARIRHSHIALLKDSPCGILVTDTALRHGEEAWSPLLDELKLPHPLMQWVWDIAPGKEHGLKGRGGEQRRVEAFVFGTRETGHENLCPIESAH